MTANAWIQVLVFLGLMLAMVKPLGWYIARVYQGKPCGVDRAIGWLERLIYRIAQVNPAEEMTWRVYARACLLFNLLGFVAVYGLQRLQGVLPLNPQGLPGVNAESSFNTAVSFATNTNWQAYAGETTMSYLTQMLGLGVQNFLSAATGMAVLVALIRGITRRSSGTIGNWWSDLVRSTLYILLPMSFVLALGLVASGVIQNFQPFQKTTLVQSNAQSQVLPMGPAAAQIAIKQLGTNGGGFFNVNSAHPFENPTPTSNLLQMLAILIIPAALCFTFGEMVGDRRQGWAILAAMFIIFVPLLLGTVVAEQWGNICLDASKIDQQPSEQQSGGNMEGKETRFGIVNSAIWATATTAASNGSVNAMHDSLTPVGGLIPLWMMQLGEVIFGGVGSGLYGMLMFALVAVFIAGLMVGRTPEYLGKKIEAFEMKMASLCILIPPLVVLIGTAIAISGPGLKCFNADGSATSTLSNPGAHGFTEVLYAFSSAGNNNGSAFAGLNANTPFHNFALGLAMLVSRYWLIIPVLAIAGSLARKKHTPTGSGTLPTHTPLFVVLLVGTVILVGALTFVPALALGPITEHLQMIAR